MSEMAIFKSFWPLALDGKALAAINLVVNEVGGSHAAGEPA
jgi:hypothetical protein